MNPRTGQSTFTSSSSYIVSVLLILILTVIGSSSAAAQSTDGNRFNLGTISDPYLTLQVLEELIASLRSELSIETAEKRQFDGGYGSRYVAAHSVGSKLMALKQAADWNGPGRKRRQTITW